MLEVDTFVRIGAYLYTTPKNGFIRFLTVSFKKKNIKKGFCPKSTHILIILSASPKGCFSARGRKEIFKNTNRRTIGTVTVILSTPTTPLQF